MKNDLNNLQDEINLKEYFATFWAYKFVIIITTIICIIYAITFISDEKKLYQANALFKLDIGEKSSNISLTDQMDSLSLLMGAGSGKSGLTGITEQFQGRVFIEAINGQLDLKNDLFFNSYNKDYVEPVYRKILKDLIGITNIKKDENEIIWRSIIKKYKKYISLEITEAKNLRLSVIHEVPERSSHIANVIMQALIKENEDKRALSSEMQLDYLSTALADAKADLEFSQNMVKDFTLENSVTSVEKFGISTIKLEQTRSQYSRTVDLYDAVYQMKNILIKNPNNPKSYAELKSKNPIVDQVEFRQLFGLSENISEWSWPSVIAVSDILETLDERKIRLKSNLSIAQIKAESLAKNVEKFATLERNLNVSQAAYTVLLEQVKTNTLLTGYQPNQSEIHEFASTPIKAIHPKPLLILQIFTMIGIFIGLCLSLILSRIKNVYFTRSVMISESRANYSYKINILKKLRNKTFQKLSSINKDKNKSVFRNLIIQFNKSGKKIILLSNFDSKTDSYGCAKFLSLNFDGKVACVNFSKPTEIVDNEFKDLNKSQFQINNIFGSISELAIPSCPNPINFLSKKTAYDELHQLTKIFDIVILSANNNDAFSLANVLHNDSIFHVALARRKNTKQYIMKNFIKNIQLEALLHD